MLAILGNMIYGAQGSKSKFKASDFLSNADVKPMTADQLRSMAIMTFGPPPSTNN